MTVDLLTLATAPTVLDYLSSRAADLIEKLPQNHPASSPSYEYHTPSLSNHHTNLMYSNWIGLHHGKSPNHTNYLLGLQGKKIWQLK